MEGRSKEALNNFLHNLTGLVNICPNLLHRQDSPALPLPLNNIEYVFVTLDFVVGVLTSAIVCLQHNASLKIISNTIKQVW
jgi:hypothetical protein